MCTKACILEASMKERFEGGFEAMPRPDGRVYAFDSIIEGDRGFKSACDIGNSYILRRTCDDNRCITPAVDPMFEYSNAVFEEAMKKWTSLSLTMSDLGTIVEDTVTAAVAKGVLQTPHHRIREYILDKLNNEPLLKMKGKEFEIANMKIITDLPAVQVTVEVVIYRPTLAQGKHLLLDFFMGPFEISLQSGRVLGVVNIDQMENAYDEEKSYAEL